MTKLPDFDRILYLVEHHGEPDDCVLNRCSVCDEIYSARKVYAGKEGVKEAFYVPTPKFRYIVIDENGRTKTFHKKSDVIKHMRTSAEYVDPIINTDKSYKGFTVARELVDA